MHERQKNPLVTMKIILLKLLIVRSPISKQGHQQASPHLHLEAPWGWDVLHSTHPSTWVPTWQQLASCSLANAGSVQQAGLVWADLCTKSYATPVVQGNALWNTRLTRPWSDLVQLLSSAQYKKVLAVLQQRHWTLAKDHEKCNSQGNATMYDTW